MGTPLDGAGQPMILWTVQTAEAVAVLHRTGLLVADADEPEAHFRPAYRWMARKMRYPLAHPAFALTRRTSE